MPGRPTRPRAPKCGCGKRKFATQDKAITQVLWRQTNRGAPALNIYDCPEGGGFHISSRVNVKGKKAK